MAPRTPTEHIQDEARELIRRRGIDPVTDHRSTRLLIDEVVARGAVPRAMCVNDTVERCTEQLQRWTRPGWRPVDGSSCPISEPPPYADSAQRSCTILEYRK